MDDNNDFNRRDREVHPHRTEIRVEKKERTSKKWLLLPLLLVPLLLVPFLNRDDDRVGSERVGSTIERDAQVAAVTYQGQTWQPRGAARSFEADDVTAIGRSAEGHELFRGAGGGGGAAESQQVFMKTSNGMFQPLARVGEAGDGNRVEDPNH